MRLYETKPHFSLVLVNPDFENHAINIFRELDRRVERIGIRITNLISIPSLPREALELQYEFLKDEPFYPHYIKAINGRPGWMGLYRGYGDAFYTEVFTRKTKKEVRNANGGTFYGPNGEEFNPFHASLSDLESVNDICSWIDFVPEIRRAVEIQDLTISS